MPITFHALLARKHDEPTAYVVIDSCGSEIAVLDKLNELTHPAKGADFRAAHAELVLVRDFNIIEQLDFPNPALIEKQRKAAALAEALAAHNAAEEAKAKAAAAQAEAKAKVAAIKELTPEQQQMVSAHKAAQAAAVERRDEAAEAERAASEAEQARMAAGDAEIAEKAKADADKAAAERAERVYQSAKAGLEEASDEALKLSAGNNGVNIDGLSREDAIDKILTKTGHKPPAPASEPSEKEPAGSGVDTRISL
jgi:hypothetical protein